MTNHLTQNQASSIRKPASQQEFELSKRILQAAQTKVDQYGAPYVSFGVFMLLHYTLPYFLWMQTPDQYDTPMLYLRAIGGTLCVFLIVREKWHEKLLPLLPLFWYFTVLYCLPFTSTVMFLFTNASLEWLVNILGIIVLLFALVDWIMALTLGVLGAVAGMLFYKLLVGNLTINMSLNTQYLLIYHGIFATMIGFFFARRQTKHKRPIKH